MKCKGVSNRLQPLFYGIGYGGHLRSASRALTMRDDATRVWDIALRLRTLCSHLATVILTSLLDAITLTSNANARPLYSTNQTVSSPVDMYRQYP